MLVGRDREGTVEMLLAGDWPVGSCRRPSLLILKSANILGKAVCSKRLRLPPPFLQSKAYYEAAQTRLALSLFLKDG